MSVRCGPLWLHLHFPHFPLEVVTRGLARGVPARGSSVPPPRPLSPPSVVIEGEGTRAGIVACDERAAAMGLAPGMSLGNAWALAAGLDVCKRDPAGEARARQDVAAWATQFSSTVVVCPPAGIGVEVGGSLALFGGLQALLDRIRTGIDRLGFSVWMAVAPTPMAACLMASGVMTSPVLDPDRLEQALSSIPIARMASDRMGAAGLDAAALAALAKLGLRTIGECAALPRAALGRRVGGIVALLDLAYGRAPHPQPLFEPPSHFEAELSFPVPVIEVEALVFGLNRLVQALTGYLEARAAGATRLGLTLRHGAAREDTEIRLHLVAPSRDPAHLLALARERLERTSPGAGVEAVKLAVPETSALAPQTGDLFAVSASAPVRDGLAPLIERLGARLGEHAVHGLGLRADHRPERAWSPAPAGADAKRDVPASGDAGPTGPGRPIWLLHVPLRLRKLGQCPVLGGALEIESGAERIESGWWDGADISRDYYHARNPHGEKLWIFEDRREPGAWYLHGVFA